jgi:hypothetical protein
MQFLQLPEKTRSTSRLPNRWPRPPKIADAAGSLIAELPFFR